MRIEASPETVVREDVHAGSLTIRPHKVYTPECVRCGWIGRGRRLRAQADRDGEQHSCKGEK